MAEEPGPGDLPGVRPGDVPGDLAIDLSRPRRLHVVGVGGAGMSAIATVLAAMGHTVSAGAT